MTKEKSKNPPKLAEWILRRIYPDRGDFTSVGDFREEYLEVYQSSGPFKAYLWYWMQIAKSIPSFIRNKSHWSIVMIHNYLKIALRNMRRHKGYSFINITGLVIGMTCFILISQWIIHEWSYDKFHKNAGALHLVASHGNIGGTEYRFPVCPPLVGPTLKEEFPQVADSVRILDDINLIFSYEAKKIREDVTLADPTILQMFHFPLVSGDPATALSQPNSLLMTEEMAEKYFGEEDPIDKTLRLENRYLFTVTGVMKNIPNNSSIQFDFLIPISFADTYYGNGYLNRWIDYAFWTFIQLAENVSYKDMIPSIAGRIKQSHSEYDVELFLQPFTQYHLYNLGFGGGAIERIRLFAIIALFILIISIINFINLSTARAGTRLREVGMRKVIGAVRRNIIVQFYSESIILSFLASALALAFAILLLPVFNQLMAQELTFKFPALLPVIIGIILFTGIAGGSYPALFMSSFQPVNILKGFGGKGKSRTYFRKILVVMQFAISISLIIGTTVNFRQMEYIKKMDLGFDREHLICIPLSGAIRQNLDAAKHEMIQHPNVLALSTTTLRPTWHSWREIGWTWPGKPSDSDPEISMMRVDSNFLETLDVQMAEGTFFSEQTGTDSPNNIIINETLAKMMDLDDPVGNRASFQGNNYIIAGIIKDFHFMPLHTEIEPLVIFYNPGGSYMYLRIRPQDIPQTISHIESVYKKFNPGVPFDYSFFDEAYDRIYLTEQRLGTIFRYFAALAIIISCLGIFGLAASTAERRTKEIGIRKVLGAAVPGIVYDLSKEFAIWVLIANTLAWPVAYFAMNKWLQSFAYRTSISLWIFVFSATLALVIALITVSFQAIKAATANPVDSLRYE